MSGLPTYGLKDFRFQLKDVELGVYWHGPGRANRAQSYAPSEGQEQWLTPDRRGLVHVLWCCLEGWSAQKTADHITCYTPTMRRYRAQALRELFSGRSDETEPLHPPSGVGNNQFVNVQYREFNW